MLPQQQQQQSPPSRHLHTQTHHHHPDDPWLLVECTKFVSQFKIFRRSKNLAWMFLMTVLCYSMFWIIIFHSNPFFTSLDTSSGSSVQPFFHNLFWSSKDHSAACLLVMDDNHFLIEWIAYHYHTINLRKLIIVADPKSLTSPHRILERWQNLIQIEQWTDIDYGTPEEFHDAQQAVLDYFGGGQDISKDLVLHRARQRLFYYKCLQSLKIEDKYSWVLLTDSDEFITLNYPTIRQSNLTTNTAPPITQPGSIIKFLRENIDYAPQLSLDDSTTTTNINDNQPLYILQSSPCIQIPRIRFGAQEPNELPQLPEGLEKSSNSDSSSTTSSSLNASDFVTLNYRTHAASYDYKLNKISKTLIDLSRVQLEEILPVDSIHMPIRSICQQRRLHIRKSQSLLVINHYLGSQSQFTSRKNDARSGNMGSNERSIDKWNQYQDFKNAETDDAIVPWITGFVQKQSSASAKVQQLLEDVGKLDLTSWYTWDGNPQEDRCALVFFGLPRAYRDMVLPSIVRNILIPNARHNCDVYVHFYEQYEEIAGRKNRGGYVNPTEVFLLADAVKAVQNRYGPKTTGGGRNANRQPIVAYTHDTEKQFWDRRGEDIQGYHNTMTKDGLHPAYYPWKAKTYTNSSLDNIVKQWHSIEYGFKLMQITARKNQINYTRVAMLRNDAMYMTPIDIAMIDKGIIDTSNQYVTVAPFARLPINDRMIYGPYAAVKIWATERFKRIEDRVRLEQDPGYEMHSERFLNATIFPAIEALGYKVQINRDICFVRTRADESAMITDCSTGGITRGWDYVNKKQLVEDIVQKNCTYYKMGFKWTFVGCGEGIQYVST